MACADGCFYMFDVNTQEGGVCKLITQASFYTPTAAPFATANNPSGGAVATTSGNMLVNTNTAGITTTTTTTTTYPAATSHQAAATATNQHENSSFPPNLSSHPHAFLNHNPYEANSAANNSNQPSYS